MRPFPPVPIQRTIKVLDSVVLRWEMRYGIVHRTYLALWTASASVMLSSGTQWQSCLGTVLCLQSDLIRRALESVWISAILMENVLNFKRVLRKDNLVRIFGDDETLELEYSAMSYFCSWVSRLDSLILHLPNIIRLWLMLNF